MWCVYGFICVFMFLIVLFFCFFFSSRRRHTRLTCDWSSDVCSSDLRRLIVTVSLGVLHARTIAFDPAPESALRAADSLLFGDRKSTRLNSSHMSISYAVFCLKKKKKKK